MKVLVVGCSGGIGSEISVLLHNLGYELIGLDRERPRHPDIFSRFYKTDLRATGEVLAACRKVKDAGDLWAIIYIAGIYPIVAAEDYSIALWDEVHSVNVRSAFIIFKELAPSIKKGGRIVTIVSGAAHIGSRDLAYSASKAGLLGLTKSLALNLAKKGILANAVCPGVIDTKMSARMNPGDVKTYKKKILLGRKGSPAEVAVAVEYLLNPRNTYMTGATIDVNGGLYLR